MSDKLKAAMLAFEDFLNEPPQYEDKRMVREYRHEAYRKWSELRDQITAALPPAQEWQNINTAPKDETRVLLARAGIAAIHTAFWRSGVWHCGNVSYFNNPTHWMPLPTPPVAVIADHRTET